MTAQEILNARPGSIVSRGSAGRAAQREQGRMFREPRWVWQSRGDVGWWLRPEWVDTLIGPEGLKLDQWRAEGRLTTVKTGPHRVVYRAELPEGAIYIKHYLVPDLRSKLRQWFRRGKGRNEGKRAIRLAALGIPTITPIALGEQRRRKFLFENYLISPAIPDSSPLSDLVERWLPSLPEPRRGRVRRQLATALGTFTARLHEAGLFHIDFHPGNLLVRVEASGPQLAMIDLDALRERRKGLSWPEVQANLALLNHYFWTRSTRTDRARFLRAYLAARRQRPDDPKELARGIEASTRAWAERLWRRWGKRCWGSNKYFQAIEKPRGWAIASRSLDASVVEELLTDPDAPYLRPGTTILKSSRTTTVAELTLPVQGQPTPVIYKRFNRKKRFESLLNLARPSRAWRAWQAGQHFAVRGVPTPTNLAILARTGLANLPRETYLVTVKAEPAQTLGDYLRSSLAGLDRAARLRLTQALAQLIRTMHDRSLAHRDLKAANILLEGDPKAPEPRLSLIDLVGARLSHPLKRSWRVQNLARLYVSMAEIPGTTRTDALRFLRIYLPHEEQSKSSCKALWREVAEACRRKQARNLRSGRPLS